MLDAANQKMTAKELRKKREASSVSPDRYSESSRMASPSVADITRNPEKYRKMSEDAVDNEFAIGIAPYSNYTEDIDPSIARYHGVKGLSGNVEEEGILRTRGFQVGEHPSHPKYLEPRVGRVDGRAIVIPVEQGTVNAIHSNATPATWSHEYRHKSTPNISERDNRVIDAAVALTKTDWKGAVEMWLDQLNRWDKNLTEPKNYTTSEAERHLLGTLKREHNYTGTASQQYERERKRKGKNLDDSFTYKNMRTNQAYWPKRLEEIEEFESWSRELAERNSDRRKKEEKE